VLRQIRGGLPIKLEVLPSEKNKLLIINSLYVSAQSDHHQAILEEYKNDDEGT
jgi:hypothetical protein